MQETKTQPGQSKAGASQFPIILQSKPTNGFTFFRRIHADGRVEKKFLDGEWEQSDTPVIQMNRLEKYLYQMTERLGWRIQSK